MTRLTPQLLVSAYCQGIFPMADRFGRIHWYDPEPRAIIPLETFHMPRRLGRLVRSGRFEVRYDTSFRTVMEICAEAAPGREETWISPELVDVYVQLHQLGLAHSVETWRAGQLVGGLYGVTVRGLFAGESMFSRESDASKVALVHLIERLKRGGFALLDTQFLTEHLAQFGAYTISRNEYRRRLVQALEVEARWDAA
jgi:leucyl/phenylalanyl-tRNA--protein transferase